MKYAIVPLVMLIVILCLLVALGVPSAKSAEQPVQASPELIEIMMLDNISVESATSATGEHVIVITVHGREAQDFLEGIGKRVISFPEHGVIIVLDPDLPI